MNLGDPISAGDKIYEILSYLSTCSGGLGFKAISRKFNCDPYSLRALIQLAQSAKLVASDWKNGEEYFYCNVRYVNVEKSEKSPFSEEPDLLWKANTNSDGDVSSDVMKR